MIDRLKSFLLQGRHSLYGLVLLLLLALVIESRARTTTHFYYSTPNPTKEEFLKDWQDIGEFSFIDYNYAPYSGTSRLGYTDYRIKILASKVQSLELDFSLEIAFNGGARIRNWGNYNSCYNEESEEVNHTILLRPLSAQKAEIIFPEFPQCKLLATRDSQNLRIEQDEQSKTTNACAFLEQKCEFDAPEMNYIAKDYYKIKAGFDCQKAGTLTEKAICANADLANDDRAINVLYLGAREEIKEFALDEAEIENLPLKQNLSKEERQKLILLLQEKFEAQREALYQRLLQEQRTYLKKRESCKGEAECIKKILDDRVSDLIHLSPYLYIVENRLLKEPSLQKFFDIEK